MTTVIERDVIVVGAGPAGAVCAAYMAKAGLDVLLIDKDAFPRDKVCGDMVKAGFVKHVQALDSVDLLDELSSCIRRLKLVSCSHEAVVPFECYTLPRYKLDKMLVDAALSWGVELRQCCRAVDIIKEKNTVKGVVVREKGVERRLMCRLLICADGVGNDMGKIMDVVSEKSSGMWLGMRAYFKGVKLDKKLVEDQYNAGGIFGFDEKGGPAYFWILPTGADGVEKGICNVGMIAGGRDEHKLSDLEKRMNAWVEKQSKEGGVFEDSQKLSPWSFSRISDITQEREPAGNGYIFIGDAAARVMPLICDGLSAAGDTAKAAAEAALAAFEIGDFSKEHLSEVFEASMLKQQEEAMNERAEDGEEKLPDGTGLTRTEVIAYDRTVEDKMKIDMMLIESLYVPETIEMIVEKLGRDPNYRKLV